MASSEGRDAYIRLNRIHDGASLVHLIKQADAFYHEADPPKTPLAGQLMAAFFKKVEGLDVVITMLPDDATRQTAEDFDADLHHLADAGLYVYGTLMGGTYHASILRRTVNIQVHFVYISYQDDDSILVLHRVS